MTPKMSSDLYFSYISSGDLGSAVALKYPAICFCSSAPESPDGSGTWIWTSIARIIISSVLFFRRFSGKEVDTDSGETRRRKLRLESLVEDQPCFSRTGEEDIEFDKILIGKAMRGVIGYSECPVEAGSGHMRRQRMKLQYEQTEPSHIWRPATQMADQILFQFTRRNFLAQARKCAGRSHLSRSANVIGRWKIRATMIKEYTNVKQVN